MTMRALGAMLAASARPTLCRACLLRSITASRQRRHPLHLGTIEKRRLAQEEWDERAAKILNGEHPNLWEEFKARGYVKDIAGTDEQINEIMRRKRIGVYVGIDPTAASLHLGHLLPLMPLFWMYMHGYRSISLIGGATAKIGDPTGRLTTRAEYSKGDRSIYITKMHYQLKRIWQNVDIQAAKFGYEKKWSWNRELINNGTWLNSRPISEIVGRLFTRMRVGTMLTRETVKRKMTEGDGMSLAEFVYPMMQAWDWWEMFSSPKGVCMQIGGSDQYGNIVAGIDAVKILRDTEPNPAAKLPNDLLHTPVGFTVPLLTDAAGNKFGKSAGNAMWLDPYQTSSFDLYGYFMRRPDADVERLLKLFTFLPLKQIDEVMKQHNLDPSKRHAHQTLALEVLSLVHSKDEAEAVHIQHKQIFHGGIVPPAMPTAQDEQLSYPGEVTPATSNNALRFRPDIQLPESLIMGRSVARILWSAGLADSATDAHRLIAQQGAYVGGAPGRRPHENLEMRDGEITFQSVKNWFHSDTPKFLIDGKILILRRGKHFIRVIEMVSDEEWEASGQSYPGEAGKGRMRQLKQQLVEANAGKDPHFTSNELARVGEEIDRMEREGAIALKYNEISKPQITFPPQRSRAAQLLDEYSRARKLNPLFLSTMKQKTEAIDAVLRKAQSVIASHKSSNEQQHRIKDDIEN